MNIAVDLRSLSTGTISGVENYTINLLENLLPLDKQNSYTLFYNGLAKSKFGDFHFVNSRVKNTRWPNKLLNLAFKSNLMKLENLAGDFDCLFMPNLNQFYVRSKAKVVLTVHDLSPVLAPEFYNVKRRLWHWFLNYKKAFSRADLLLAVSEYTKQDLIKCFNIDPNKIKVVYPGIDHKSFKPISDVAMLRSIRNQYSLPGDFILFLNTIEPRKNLINLIKAFDQLDSPCDLVIAGRKGWKYSEIFDAAKASKKFAKIHYIGYIPEEQKPAIISLARVLVYPSFYEGFGFQPIESMALGVPTVASNVTALPEITGDAALLVNPYDVLGIAKALKVALEDEQLRSRLKEKGLQRAKDFSWQKSAQGILDGFNKLNS